MPVALVGVFYDDGIYLALAKSLAEGHGYQLHYLPGSPAGIHYPFLYPAFLAGLWALWPSFPANVAAMRLANALLLGIAAALIVAHLGPRLPVARWLTALVVTLAATAVPMIAVATVLFSEPLFLVIAAGACWAADAALKQDEGSVRLAVLAGALAGLAALTRSIGVTVIGGVVIALLWKRHWRDAAAAAVPAMILVVPWMAWSGARHATIDPLLVSNYGTYGDFLRQGGAGWLSPMSLVEVVRPLGAVSLPPLPAIVRIVLGLLALAVLLAGMVRLTRLAPAAGWMLWCYVAVTAVWPYAPERFVWGILPWLAAAFAAGVRRMMEGGWWMVDKHAGRESIHHPPSTIYLPLCGAIAALTVATGFSISQFRGLRHHGPIATQVGISETMNDILPWIRAETDTASIIAGEDEALIWLYTGRRAVPSYLWRVRGREAESFGPDSLHAWLERSGATHLILAGRGSDAAPTIDALLARRPGYLQLVHMWPGPLLAFRIHRGA